MQLISAGSALKIAEMPKGTWDTLRARGQFHLTAELTDTLQYVKSLDDQSRSALLEQRGRAGSYLWTVEDVVRLSAVVALARFGVSVADAATFFSNPWFSIPQQAVISFTDGKPTVKLCDSPAEFLAKTGREPIFTAIDLDKMRREV